MHPVNVEAAVRKLLGRGLRPVRIWLTVYDLNALCHGRPIPRRRRYMGLPVSVAHVPARSRVIAENGACELI